MSAEFMGAPGLGVAHGFFTRKGGVSKGPYAELNCGRSSADDPDRVMQNRALAARAIGADPAALVGLHQVHGRAVAQVEAPWAPGDGPRADAMVTRIPGIALGIVTADCAPVLFADRQAGVVGAAHAGWRGALAGVLEETVRAMVGLGAAPDRIAAALGPCIQQESYEVGADMRGEILGHDPAHAAYFADGRRPGHWQFDLPGYCAARLALAGVTRVEDMDADTLSNERRFFSHRRRTLMGGGPIGHQISIVML